jgi:hypothetical protein
MAVVFGDVTYGAGELRSYKQATLEGDVIRCDYSSATVGQIYTIEVRIPIHASVYCIITGDRTLENMATNVRK